MKKRKIAQIVAFINLLIVGILVADTYLLPLEEFPAIVKQKTMPYTSSRAASHGYTSWLIRDQNGIQYSVPDDSFHHLSFGDSFTVLRTTLFKKAIKIKYNTDTRTYSRDIGVINETFFGVFVMTLISLFSLIQILAPNFFRSDYVEFKTTIAITSITIVAIFYYFHDQA